MKKSKKSLSRKASSKKILKNGGTNTTSENQNLTLLTSSNLMTTNRNNTLLTQPSGSVRSRVINGVHIPSITIDPESTMRDRYDIKTS